MHYPECAMAGTSKCHNTDEHGRKAIITMTKKKYSILEKRLKDFADNKGIDGETLEELCVTICDALAFNPDLQAYKSEEIHRRKEEYKKKLAAQGLNTYDDYGRAYYQANREACIQKNAMYNKIRDINPVHVS